jgi:hypothetical protein
MRARSIFGTLAEEKFSAPDRFWKAMESFTQDELLRLETYATWRIRGLGYLAAGRESGDLLHEAIAASVDGRRPWKEDTVPLFAHLLGVMRSISSGWHARSAFERRAMSLDQVDPQENIPEAGSWIEPDSVPAREPSPENLASARQLIDSLTQSLAEDKLALEVLTAMMAGWQDKEIPAELHTSRRQYEAAKKRIRRRLQKIIGSESTWRKRVSSEVP